MDKIVLKNMAFYGYHGNLASEKELGQRFFVDVTICRDLTKAGKSDNLEDSLNYVLVYDVVKEIVEGESCNLIERVATLIADRLWEGYTEIVGLAVALRKPEVPIPGILDYVEVVITRGQI